MGVARAAISVFCMIAACCAQSGPPQHAAEKPREPRSATAKQTPQCASHHTFTSPSLKREMGYCIILPAEYDRSPRTYPVLYLLHGLYGSENDWQALTSVGAYVRGVPLVVVMPEGDDSWYSNSVAEPSNRYEDYLFHDVVEEIEAHYRVTKSREGRLLAGLSMGGYAALKGATKYPELFMAVGSFSASLRSHEDDGRWITTTLAFGKQGSATRRGNDVFLLLAKADITTLPYVFQSVGEQDDLQPVNRRFAQMMRDLGVTYEYCELPGRHEWTVWDTSLRLFLDSLVRHKLLPAS
jgi:putative tributyrin esterase